MLIFNAEHRLIGLSPSLCFLLFIFYYPPMTFCWLEQAAGLLAMERERTKSAGKEKQHEESSSSPAKEEEDARGMSGGGGGGGETLVCPHCGGAEKFFQVMSMDYCGVCGRLVDPDSDE